MITDKFNLTTEDALKYNVSFIVEDIAGVAKELKLKAKIQEIYYHHGDDLKEEFVKYLDAHKSENTIFCTSAYASTEEFSEKEYYLTEDKKEEGKKPLPIDEILERDSKILTECGFVNINDFVGYEYKVAFIYPNEPGLKVIEKIKELLSEDK